MFRLNRFKIFHSLRNRNLLRLGVLAGIYGVHTMTKKRGFGVFEADMKLIFPNLTKTNRHVEINNYYQLESLVNSAYQNNIQMRIKRIHDTSREDLGLSKDINAVYKKRIPTPPSIIRRKAVEIDIQGLSAIKKIYPEDRLVVVEGGICIDELNRQLKPYGLMFPTPLIHDESVMEMINENLLLANSYKDGSIRNHIEDIILMTPSSKLIKTGNRTGDDF